MSRPIVAVVAIIMTGFPTVTLGQADVSLAFGAGTVRFPGDTYVALVSLGPVLTFDAPNRTVWLGGTVAALPDGDWYGQGRFSIWAATPLLTRRWRLATEVELAGASRGVGTETASGTLVLEMISAAPRWGIGFGVGPETGLIRDKLPVTALRTRLRGWWLKPMPRVLVSASIEPTRLPDSWFTDLGAGLDVRQGRLTTRVSAVLRATQVLTGAAIAAIEIRLKPAVSLEAAAGSVLRDPYQGFPRSGFFTLGLRLHASTRPLRSIPASHVESFTVIRQGGEVILRLRNSNAHTVEIAGDWNDWIPAPLRRGNADAWEVMLELPPGIYHFALLLDGTSWVTPDGVATLSDGMGGRVAVLTIP